MVVHPRLASPWTARGPVGVRGTLLALGEASADDDERILAVSRMMYETPPLRARSIEKHLRWYDDLNYFDAALDAIRRPSVDAG